MQFNELRTAAFVPAPGVTHLLHTYHTVAFPHEWREPIYRYYRHGKPESPYDKYQSVPIGYLNQALLTLAPDLVTVGKSASFDPQQPWIFADEPFSPAVMSDFLRSWLHSMHPEPEAHAAFKDVFTTVNSTPLPWQLTSVNLLEHTLSTSGTRIPANFTYRVLTDVIANRIAALPPYTHAGQQVSFVQVATNSTDSHAELVSWPPLSHVSVKKGVSRTWWYSGVITVALRTVPFSPVPRIHLDTGIRRWVGEKVRLPFGRGASVHLRTPDSLFADMPAQSRFATASISRDRDTGKIMWRHNQPGGILSGLSAWSKLPSAQEICDEPDRWRTGQDGFTAAVPFHTMMRVHDVDPGLMPSERRRLTEWAAQALEPDFVWAPVLHRSKLKSTPAPTLQERKSLPKDPGAKTLAELAAIAEHNAYAAVQNGATRRDLIATALNRQPLSVLVLSSSDAVRDELIHAAETNLDLTTYRVDQGPKSWIWKTPELDVHLHVEPLGAIGDAMGDGSDIVKHQARRDAFDVRVSEVRARVAQLTGGLTPRPDATVVVLGSPNTYPIGADPKHALRVGCAKAGLVSQFLLTHDPKFHGPKDNLAARAEAAWADVLRQLGIRLVPQHRLGEAIPEDLTQVAFWLIKRRAKTASFRQRQFTPLAIMIPAGGGQILAKLDGHDGWIPYPELLKQLCQTQDTIHARTNQEQKLATATFAQNVIYQFRSRPTLILAHAENARSLWPGLQNQSLIPDMLQIGDRPSQPLPNLYPRLHLVRVAGKGEHEVPQWWAPKPDGKGGITKGLWKDPGLQSPRVFYSTTDKALSMQTPLDVSKLTPHIDPNRGPIISPAKMGATPELLELTVAGVSGDEDPEAWAMFVHLQRFAEDYRSDLGLPLALHMAKLVDAYAVPSASDAVNEAPASDEPETEAEDASES